VLVDFGIALDEERTRLTEVGMVPGTVAYMPPELLLSDSRTVDASLTDVYAFGLVFYEAITRRRAFPGFQNASRQDLVRLVQEKMDHEPFDPGEIATPAIRGLIKGCTNPMPLKRPRMKGVVRLLELALAPTPGLMAASAAEEGDEPTMVMARGFDSPPTFAVDTVKTPLPMDLRPPAATPKVVRPRDPTPPRPMPQMDIPPLRRPGTPAFGQAPFDERTADLADQQVVDQATLRAELARGRRAAAGRDTVIWLGAFGVVLFLVLATLVALGLGWWFSS
jgi:serine/threonine protein kinase